MKSLPALRARLVYVVACQAIPFVGHLVVPRLSRPRDPERGKTGPSARGEFGVPRLAVAIMPRRESRRVASVQMKGARKVPDFLDRVASVLAQRPSFTEREPVYVIDPTGSEFGIELASTVEPIPRVAEEPQPPKSLLERPVVSALRGIYRTLAPRLNRIVDSTNRAISLRTGHLQESMRRLAVAQRSLEDRLEKLETERSSVRAPQRQLADPEVADTISKHLESLEERVAALEARLEELARIGNEKTERGAETSAPEE